MLHGARLRAGDGHRCRRFFTGGELRTTRQACRSLFNLITITVQFAVCIWSLMTTNYADNIGIRFGLLVRLNFKAAVLSEFLFC